MNAALVTRKRVQGGVLCASHVMPCLPRHPAWMIEAGPRRKDGVTGGVCPLHPQKPNPLHGRIEDGLGNRAGAVGTVFQNRIKR